jgi:zinc transporter 5/7
VLDMGEEKEAEVRKALTAVRFFLLPSSLSRVADEILEQINRLEGVSSFTKPRFWQKDPSSMVGSICIQLAPAPGYNAPSSHSHSHTQHVVPKYFANIEKTTARVRRTLRANIGGLEEVVIQVEPTGGFAEGGGGGELGG